MKAIFFIVILWLNDGNFHTTSIHVESCPPKQQVEKAYEKLRLAHQFKNWSAICTTVNFDKPLKEPPPVETNEELKV